jgi:hypothetical protein
VLCAAVKSERTSDGEFAGSQASHDPGVEHQSHQMMSKLVISGFSGKSPDDSELAAWT